MAGPEVIAVNRTRALLLLDTDDIVRIDTMLDSDAEETDDAYAAVAAIAQLPDGRWLAVDLTMFPSARPH